MTEGELQARVAELESAIRNHRDQKGDDRCWMDDQSLYAVLKDGNLGDNTVGDQAKMLKNCERYVHLRCQGGGGWKSYAELEAANNDFLRAIIFWKPSEIPKEYRSLLAFSEYLRDGKDWIVLVPKSLTEDFDNIIDHEGLVNWDVTASQLPNEDWVWVLEALFE
jgi:hypothetical protein